jgi:hypothetical protein
MPERSRRLVRDTTQHRVLGALQFVDATDLSTVTAPLAIMVAKTKLIRNRSGLYVLYSVKGLEDYTDSFTEAPAVGALPPLAGVVSDASGRYLDRAFSFQLPRDPSPDHFPGDNSVFSTIDIPLYRSPLAPVRPTFSVIRGDIAWALNSSSLKFPCEGALALIKKSGTGEILGRGMSDRRGEFLVVVPGVPPSTFSDGGPMSGAVGSVMVFEIGVTLEVVFDPSGGWPVDPDVLEVGGSSGFLTLTKSVTLKAGRMERESIVLLSI